MSDKERKTVNVYSDTKISLDKVKELLEFKSDDQTIKFLCNYFLSQDNQALYEYIKVKSG